MIREMKTYVLRKLGRHDQFMEDFLDHCMFPIIDPTKASAATSFVIHLNQRDLDRLANSLQVFGRSMTHVATTAAQANAEFEKLSGYFRANPQWGAGPYGNTEEE